MNKHEIVQSIVETVYHKLLIDYDIKDDKVKELLYLHRESLKYLDGDKYFDLFDNSDLFANLFDFIYQDFEWTLNNKEVLMS